MKTKEKNEIYLAARNLWGINTQLVMVMEECAELQHAVSKQIRGSKEASIEKIAEEIADVEIMIEQVKYLWSLNYQVGKIKNEKLARLKTRVEAAIILSEAEEKA